MIVGFTGTRAGMNRAQEHQLVLMLSWIHDIDARISSHLRELEFHQGGADGADTEAAKHARLLGYQVHVHPCPGVVRTSLDDGAVWHEVLPPLQRNRNIVSVAFILIAAPDSDVEKQRSGTWATVRYARAALKPVVMLSRGER